MFALNQLLLLCANCEASSVTHASWQRTKTGNLSRWNSSSYFVESETFLAHCRQSLSSIRIYYSRVQNLWQVSRYLLDVFSLLSIAKRFLPYRSLGLLHTRHTQTHSVYPRCHSRTEIKFMEIKSLKFFQLMLLTAGWLRWYLFSQPQRPYHFQLLFCALCQSFPMHFVCDLKWRSSLSFVHSLHFYYYYSVGCDFCAVCAVCTGAQPFLCKRKLNENHKYSKTPSICLIWCTWSVFVVLIFVSSLHS